tara:strand:- start:277 stop:621 length:345 start_codon:yes stop_codon:yes gene_type:complete
MPNADAVKPFQWKKGECGNPNGRPKKIPEIDKLLAEVLGEEKDGITAAEAILKALRAKASKGDIRAAEVLLDRAYGKATTNLNLKNENITIRVVRDGDNTQITDSSQQSEGSSF